MNIKIKSTEKSIRVNKGITAQKIRLIDQNGDQKGIVDLNEAIYQAELADLDLVEIAPTANPPVCRIMDYGKYLFEIKKKKAAQRTKQKQTQIKEIKLRPTTDVGDYQVKIRNIIRFLKEGDKVKVTVRFRGRELMHPELGLNLLKKIEEDLSGQAVVEQQPKLEAKQMSMLLGPRKS
jgi:translation initiation factor IF-3